MGDRDEEAAICRDGNGDPEHDSDLRERERVPIGTDPRVYFAEEVEPYLENAWINESSKYCDEKDGNLGVVGYEIGFDQYFYYYDPPRPPGDINEELREIENEITEILETIVR